MSFYVLHCIYVWVLYDSQCNVFFMCINKMIFIMVKCCFFFVVQAEFLSFTYTSYGFKGLILKLAVHHCIHKIMPLEHVPSPVHTITTYNHYVRFNNILPSVSWSPKWPLPSHSNKPKHSILFCIIFILPAQPAWQDQMEFPSDESEEKDCWGQVLHCHHKGRPPESLQQMWGEMNFE